MLAGDTPAQDKINKRMFEKLCSYQCTEEEIAGIFEIDADTLLSWCKKTYNCTFSEIYKRYCQSGKLSLRRIQWKHAEKSASMAIFLGKQYLGQKDVVEQQMNPIEDLTPLAELLKGNNNESSSNN